MPLLDNSDSTQDIASQLPTVEKLNASLESARQAHSAEKYRQEHDILKSCTKRITELSHIDKIVEKSNFDTQWRSAMSEVLWRIGASYFWGQGAMKNRAKASLYFAKSHALATSAENLYYLALIKEHGHAYGARLLFSQAVQEFNHAESMYRLGIMLLNEGSEEQREAVRLFQKCMELECANGFFAMGLCYERGIGGLERSEREALRFYSDAASRGSVGAMDLLFKIHRNGLLGQKPNDNLAEKYAKMGSAKSHAKSKFFLGALNSKSDPFNAAIYFQEAIILGHNREQCLHKISKLRFPKNAPYKITFDDQSPLIDLYCGTVYAATYNSQPVLARFVNSKAMGVQISTLSMRLTDEMNRNNKVAGPHNCRIHTVKADESFVLVISDYLPSSLNSFIYGHTQLNTQKRMAIIHQIAQGMHKIHNHGFLHTALTGGMVGVSGSHTKVIGIENSLVGSIWERIEDVRDNLYAAPEVKSGAASFSVESDIYSFGLVAFKILIGALPSQLLKRVVEEPEDDSFNDAVQTKVDSFKRQLTSSDLTKHHEVVKEDVNVADEPGFSSLPDKCQKLLLGCLQPEPQHRYRSFAEICSLF